MNTTRTRAIALGLIALLVAVVAIVIASGGGTDDASAASTDRAFTAEMVPHHESAVDMAKIAKERSKRPEIQKLADEIIAAQDQEIGQMKAIDARLADAGAKKGTLGGMAMMDMDMGSLETAEPFDRAFIDMMIPHHQSAIKMARTELDKGTDEETRKLATAIIDAQTREINQMNEYRKAWFGAESPAGGAPAE